MLELKSASKQFNQNQAVEDVSLRVAPGGIYSLIGPNGSGKTTIIKMVAGLLRPDSGSIRVNGVDALADPVKAKSFLGYIPDEPTAWSSITGEEFLHLVGALYGVEEKERQARIPGLLDLFSLSGVEKDYFEDYSRGNKQKFTILAALLHKPKLLLIDEPIVGLDPVSAETAEKLFVDFVSQGGAMLMVTHTLPVADRISGFIGLLDKGKLVQSGTPAALRQKAGLEQEARLDSVYKALT